MNNLKTIFAAGAIAAALAGNAAAAGYVKFDGEAIASDCAEAQKPARKRMAGRPSEETAPDACAAQAVVYGKDGKKEGNVETTWKVEEGES